MTVVDTLEKTFVESGYVFVREYDVSKNEVETVFDTTIPDEYQDNPFDFVYERLELTDSEFINQILDERDGNYLVSYDGHSEGFNIFKIDGRTLSN